MAWPGKREAGTEKPPRSSGGIHYNVFMRRACFLLLILAIACVLPRTGNAELVESKHWLVRKAAQKNLDALTEYFGFPNPEMENGEAVVLIDVTGLRAEILVVGPIEGNAIEYAQVLDDWRSAAGFVGDVEYLREDDCAAAKVSVGAHRFGILDGSLKLHLNDLRQRLQTVEPKTSVALQVVSKVPVQISDKPDKVTQSGVRYWDLTSKDLAKPYLIVELNVPTSLVVSFVSWALFLPVWTFVSYLIFRRWRVNSSAPIERQRHAFSRIVNRTLYSGLALHVVTLALAVRTKYFDPLSYVWFGDSWINASSVFPVVTIVLAVIAFVAIPTLGRKIFGPTPLEIILQEENSLEVEPDPTPGLTEFEMKVNHWINSVRAILVGLGIVIIVYGWTLSDSSPYKKFAAPTGFIVFALVPSLLPYCIIRKKLDPFAQPRGQEAWEILTEKVAEISEKAGITLQPVLLHERDHGRYSAYATGKNSISVTPSIVLRLSEEEVDWTLAREAARHTLAHRRKRWLLYFGLALVPCTFILVFLLFVDLDAQSRRAAALVMPCILVMIALSKLPVWQLTQQEYAADAYATRLVGNKEAGITALKKVTLGSASPAILDMDLDGHPALQKRIAKIEALDLLAPNASV